MLNKKRIRQEIKNEGCTDIDFHKKYDIETVSFYDPQINQPIELETKILENGQIALKLLGLRNAVKKLTQRR